LVDQNELSLEFQRDTFDRYAFCFPGDGQFVGFPVVPGDATHSRGRRYNFLWYRHVRAGGDLIDLLTDCQGARHEFSIPPQLIQHRHIEVLRRMASDKLPSIFAEAVGKARQFLLQPIYELVSTRMAFGRVALVGDAAFVTRPHAGTGALKAAEDAFALSECLRLSVPVDGALRAYEARRLRANSNTVCLGRYLGAFIERGLSGPEADPRLELDAEKIVTISARPTEDVLRFLPPSF
jgi:2-polyprenyl-6-methoxyphenol hydroxylase-like FAD-dependent oxidoreductase